MILFSLKVQDSNSEPVKNDGAISTTNSDRNGDGVLSGKLLASIFLLCSIDVTVTYRESDTETTSDTKTKDWTEEVADY